MTARDLALDRSEVRRVHGDVLPRRVEQREERDPAVPLRMLLEEERERAKAADDVLRRIRPVDAHDEGLGPALLDQPLLLEDARVVAERGELGRCRC